MYAKLKLPIQTEKQLKYLQEARSELIQAGVAFDTGYDLKEGIFEWELDWSLKGAELTDESELIFDSEVGTKYIKNAEKKLKQGQIYFNTEFSENKDKIVWDLSEIRGAELKPRKEYSKNTKRRRKLKLLLKLPFNIYKNKL